MTFRQAQRRSVIFKVAAVSVGLFVFSFVPSTHGAYWAGFILTAALGLIGFFLAHGARTKP